MSKLEQTPITKINARGLFITVEGIEGAGKSTIMHSMQEFLRAQNLDLIVTREFGGTEIAEKIREVLLNHHYAEKMLPETEILLAFAGRAQHLARLIVPALQKGQWVLCDRFTDATYAYQGGGRGVAAEKIAIIEKWVQVDLRPDYTILLDLDVDVGMQRVKKTRILDRIEVEQLEFFQRVRRCYLDRAKKEPKRFRVIDASQDVEKVITDATHVLQNFIENKV